MPIIEYLNGSTVYQSPALQGAYPVMSLPASIGEPILEISTNLRLPVELAAHAALGVVSLVCQHFVNVQCPSYDPAPVSLFLMAVSNTSGGKSAAEQRFRRAVVAFERKQEAEIEAAMADYRAEIKIWEDDSRRLAKEYRDAAPESVDAAAIRVQRVQHEKGCPIKPKKWELRYEEISPQGLRDAVVANHAVGIVSPEAAPALLGMTFSQPAMLSGYWSGEDRPVGLAGGTRRPVDPRLTIAVMTQEDRFESFMKSRGADAFGAGLLGRFLFAFPKTIEWRGQSMQIEDLPEPKLNLFNQRVANILNQSWPAPDKRINLKLSDVAKCYWKWFTEAVHNELICGNFSDEMKSFFRKIGQQATRLAALFHYFDGASGDISPEAMKGAIVVCEWYLGEWMRVFTPYAPSRQQQDAEAAQKLLQWFQKATAEPSRYQKLTLGRYTERELNNFSPIRKKPMRLSAAIDALHRQGHISVIHGEKGGRIILYPATNFTGQPQIFFPPQQPAASGATGFMTPWRTPSISPTLNGRNNQTQVACSIFDQAPDQSHYASVEKRNFAAAATLGNKQSQQFVEAGRESKQLDQANGIEFESDDLSAVKRELAKRAMKAFNN